ncbi:hypothetical protein KQX54_019905 [Cotesia glomerata]|uniref:Uncharacterized protein n=1 Tax=Cotesia glomerata TaxID=32391 RepID=A0AAV7I4A4_COTGL|nr:hypothetical protein KQX54_019905 [Cotesia glomerata]
MTFDSLEISRADLRRLSEVQDSSRNSTDALENTIENEAIRYTTHRDSDFHSGSPLVYSACSGSARCPFLILSGVSVNITCIDDLKGTEISRVEASGTGPGFLILQHYRHAMDMDEDEENPRNRDQTTLPCSTLLFLLKVLT